MTMDWRHVAYNLLLVVLSPLILLWLLWRIVVKGKSRRGLLQRLGFMPPPARELARHDDPVVWFHACSVGEVAAAQPIMRAFRDLEPLAHIFLTTTTTTGHNLAVHRQLEIDALAYFPFDFPFVVGRVLHSVKPDMLVMVDTELWPNLLAQAHAVGIRTAVVNGRISDRAYPRDLAIKPILAWTLSNVDRVLAQSARDAERFVALGADPSRVAVLGNSKFDEELPVVSDAEALRLRNELGLPEAAPVLVAGSTREGEEEKVFEAYDLARQEIRDLQLIVAPRHPERADAIERLVMERGWAAFRRSRALAQNAETREAPGPSSQVRVVILDTIGELTRVYALATVVFVGGSLVPWGGHNILQPIAQGKPTIMGPWMHNQQDLADIALQEQAAIMVRDAQELAQATVRLVASTAEQQVLAARGLRMMERQRGAARRYARELSALLHGEAPPALEEAEHTGPPAVSLPTTGQPSEYNGAGPAAG